MSETGLRIRPHRQLKRDLICYLSVKGNETLHAKSLAAAVISLLPAISVADVQNFVQQLCGGVLHLWQLAAKSQLNWPR